MKPDASDQDWGAMCFRTPRTEFAINEKGVCVYNTDPPNRGVLFQTQTLTSFLTSKARGVLHYLASTFQNSGKIMFLRGLQ
jgi:hypothetical protein